MNNSQGNEFHPQDMLWFDRPATHFAETAPLGNGRLGAMPYGGIRQEQIILNETSMWSGSRFDSDREEAYKYLPRIRRLLIDGKIKEAQQVFMEHFTCKGEGTGHAVGANLPFGCYQVLGNLRLFFFQYTSHGPQIEGMYGYQRALDISKAVMFTEYFIQGVKYRREYIVSAPAEAVIIRIYSDKPGATNLTVNLDRPECFNVEADEQNGLLMTGQLENGIDGLGIKYACRVRVVSSGGNVRVRGCTIHVTKADEVLVFITAATNTKVFGGRNSDDELKASENDMGKAVVKAWDTLLSEHVADYCRYYDRMRFELPGSVPKKSALPIEKRIRALQKEGNDLGLDELYFNFGRYLLICASRPGGIPANLQGLWADEIQTPWNGDWHLNAQQMIYWPAEGCNLSDLHEPYLRLIESLVEPGTKTAKAYYNARGWVAHVCTNLWGFTSPGEEASWGSTTGSPAWLCQHMWDHYLFTGDNEYLKWAYVVMKEAARFYLDMLIEEPTNKWLVTAPSDSPENAFYTPEGDICQLCIGPTYDMQVLRFLFKACVDAATILGVDEEIRAELEEKSRRLVPTRINSEGGVMEWLEDYKEALPYHRHTSHLWGLFPGEEIDPDKTPEISEAAKKTLIKRGEVSPGWAMALRACLWARLRDGNKAYYFYQKLMKDAAFPNLLDRCYHASETEQPPIMPDLSDYDHPFQIDGNLGGAAGVIEMLLQSSMDYALERQNQTGAFIHILPALPDAWSEGKVEGIRARGGFEVDIHWKDSRPVKITIRSVGGKRCKVKHGKKIAELCFNSGESIALDGDLTRM